MLESLVSSAYRRNKPSGRYISKECRTDHVGNIGNIKPLDRRADEKEPLPPHIKEKRQVARLSLDQKINIPKLKGMLQRLAGHCYQYSSYTLQVNDQCTEHIGPEDNHLTIDVKLNQAGHSRGKVEFDFGDAFKQTLAGTALFIQEFAKYIKADEGLRYTDIIRLAYLKTPCLDSRTKGNYRIAFEFEEGRTTIGFRTPDVPQGPLRTEFLDHEKYRFNIARADAHGTNVVFERYRNTQRPVVDVNCIPAQVKGPDGRHYRSDTPGCAEHYLQIRGIDKAVVGEGNPEEDAPSGEGLLI